MYPLIAEEAALGIALIMAATVFGRWLYAKARRDPQSVLVNSGMVADLVCVTEVMLIIFGPMLLLHALLTWI